MSSRLKLVVLLRSGLCGFAVLLAACGAAAAPAVQDGDVIFQTSGSSQSRAIQRATHSTYSHMGIILYRGGRAFVFEAVATVRYTPLAEWIDRGSGGHYVVTRLRDAENVLAPAGLAKVRRVAESFQMQQRYGSRVPLDEVVISPAAMFAASNLVTVSSH